MLTDASIRKAKPGSKPFKLFDERGLFLLVHPTGGRWWRLKYRIAGREKSISLGVYPDVPLAAARAARDEARRLIASGIDPSERRKAEKLSNADTFRSIAEEWLEKFAPSLAPVTVKKNRERLAAYVYPQIGSMRVRDIDAAALLRMLRRVEGKGRKETAHRLLRLSGQIIRYAVATGRADRDPSADLRGALAPVQVEHRAAVTEPKKVAALLSMFDAYDGTPVVKAALRLAPLVFVRPGELRHAEWSEIDLDRAEWTIPAFKMKMRNSLTVPLSNQAVEILRDIYRLTGDGRYVFPSGRGGDRPMSDNAVLAAMRRMDIPKAEMTGHGWRAVARTLLDEQLGVRVDLIEAQLGHTVRDPLGRAYNRTTFLPERRKMMQQWADYLDQLKREKQEAASKAEKAG